MLSQVKESISANLSNICKKCNSIKQSDNIFLRIAFIIIKIVIIMSTCIMIGRLIIMFRNPYLISSTSKIFANFRKMGMLHLIKTIVKKYFVYMAVLLTIFLILIKSLYKLIKQNKSIPQLKDSQSSHKYERVISIILLLISFTFLAIYLIQIAKQENNDLLEAYKKGSLSEQNLTHNMNHLFPGFNKYNYLSHREQTKHLLAHFIQSSTHPHKQHLYDEIKQLLKQQDKAISTVRSFLSNIKLSHSLIYTFNYLIMGVFVVFAIFLLLCFVGCFRKQFSCRSQNYHSIVQNQEHQEEPNVNENDQKYSKCFILSYIYVFGIFAFACFGLFMFGQILMEIRAGKRFDTSIEQTTLCSFHPRQGGLGVNVDYKTQLDLSKKINQLNLNLKDWPKEQSQLAVDLQNKLDFYVNFCQIINPYFLKSKQLQLGLPWVFYSEFILFLFILWEITKIPNCCHS